YAIDKLYLKKTYDYMFTGLNTEVENFDVTVNFRWAIAVPMLGGRVHYGAATIPRKVNEALWLADRWRGLEKLQQQLDHTKELVDAAGDIPRQVDRFNQ